MMSEMCFRIIQEGRKGRMSQVSFGHGLMVAEAGDGAHCAIVTIAMFDVTMKSAKGV